MKQINFIEQFEKQDKPPPRKIYGNSPAARSWTDDCKKAEEKWTAVALTVAMFTGETNRVRYDAITPSIGLGKDGIDKALKGLVKQGFIKLGPDGDDQHIHCIEVNGAERGPNGRRVISRAVSGW